MAIGFYIHFQNTQCTYLGVLFVIIQTIQCLEWMNFTDIDPPTARRDALLAHVESSGNEFLVLFGGRNTNFSALNDTWVFRFSSNTWHKIDGDVAPPSRFSMVAGSYKDAVYLTTGEGLGSSVFNDIWVFNMSTLLWSEVVPIEGAKPDARYGAAGGIFPESDSLYFSHGFSREVRFSDVWKFDIPGARWTKLFDDGHPYSPDYPHKRCLAAATMVSGSSFVLYGGCLSGGQTGGPCPAWDSWVWEEAEGGPWRRLPQCASPRTYASLGVLPSPSGQTTDGRPVMVPCLYGGSETSKQIIEIKKAPKDEVAILHNGEWSLKISTGDVPEKRVGAAMTSDYKGKIFMFGGHPSSRELYMLSGDPLDPKVGASASCGGPFLTFFTVTFLHVIFMFSAWGLLLPLGVLVARYCRHRDPLWFHFHRACQTCGLLMAVGGLVCAYLSVSSHHIQFLHGAFGVAIVVLGLQQPINAFFRPHKESSGSAVPAKRRAWEIFHKNIGRLVLLMAVAQTFLGLFLEVASLGSVLLTAGWYTVLAVVFVALEVRLRKSRAGKLSPAGSDSDVPAGGDGGETLGMTQSAAK